MALRLVKFDIGFCLFSVAFLLIMPLRFVLACLLSVTVHELCHILALYICKIRILGLCMHMTGMEIMTDPLTRKQEFFCALAGPLGSCLLALCGRYLPLTAICAFIHAAYNLLPICPLDGGRALHSLLSCLLGDTAGQKVFEVLTRFVSGTLLLAVAWFAWYYQFNIATIGILVLVAFKALKRKSSCKQGKLIVQ